MMQIECPTCGKGYQVPDDYVGRNVKCQACNNTFVAGPSDAEPVQGEFSGEAADAHATGDAPAGWQAQSSAGAAYTPPPQKSNTTLIVLLIVGAIGLVSCAVIGLLIALLVPALGTARNTARKMSNSTQQRGIHQGFITFAQGNMTPTGDGYFPGLSPTGQVVTDFDFSAQVFTPAGEDGNLPEVRYAILLNSGFISPEYMINPIDMSSGDRLPAMPNTPITSTNFSYPLLDLGNPDSGRRREWADTINGQAAVISDRNAGTPTTPESVWTNTPGEWEGSVTFNDGSTQFISQPDLAPRLDISQYGNGPPIQDDDLFVDETQGNDALMIEN